MLEQPLADRARFGDETCSGDEHLRREVEFLLSGEQALDKMDQPVFEIAAGLLSTHIPELVAGELIGHYTILSFLGVGGMGEVYLAEDTNSSKLTRNKCSFMRRASAAGVPALPGEGGGRHLPGGREIPLEEIM